MMAIPRRCALLLLLLLCSVAASTAERKERWEEEEEEEGEGRYGGGGAQERMFMLEKPMQVVKEEGGKFTVFRGFKRRETATPMHIGFITMEPSTLFVPQYMDADLIFFVRRGEMRIGWIYKDDFVEKHLKIGDVYRIPAGSAFYIVNVGRGQRLQLICSIDTTHKKGIFQSFYIGGGSKPPSVIAGFGTRTLTTAFNVTEEVLTEILEGPKSGAFVPVTRPDLLRGWVELMKRKHNEMRDEEINGSWDDEEDEEEVLSVREEEEEEEQSSASWSWRKLLNAVLGEDNKEKKKKKKSSSSSAVKAPDAFNIYERDPDFRNNYGWSVAVSHRDYPPLRRSDVGVYLVNLTAGSMMAPHFNPTATEYGVLLRGTGTIQVVFPNGTSAMDAEVKEGDVFWIPRYYPFCQIASRSGPMEFFGFSTSSRPNSPQFLAGRSSILNSMGGDEMATALDIDAKRYDRFRGSQREEIILPELLMPPETTTGFITERAQ